MVPTLVPAKRADSHGFALAGSMCADVMVADPTAPAYIEPVWDETSLLGIVSVQFLSCAVVRG